MSAPMTVYLSGPMTGLVGQNYDAFTRAAAALRRAGLTVVSPHELAHAGETHPGSLPWTTYLRNDLQALLGCDAIALLAGWPHSRGARLELAIAAQLEFTVFFYDDQLGLTPMAPPVTEVPL